MLPQGQFQVSTMTYDPEQPQLAHRFSMKDEGTCGNARRYPESMLQALPGKFRYISCLRCAKGFQGVRGHKPSPRPVMPAGLFLSFSSPFARLPITLSFLSL